MLFDTLLSSKS